MAYLNYNACALTEGVTSSSDCNSSNAVGVQTWAGNVRGTITGITVNASGICTSIGLASGKKLYSMNPEEESLKFTENWKRSKNGNRTYTQTLEGTVANWDDITRDTYEVMLKKYTQGYVTLQNGNTYIFGINNISSPSISGGMKMEKGDWTSGQNADDELSGLQFSLVAKSGVRAIRVDSSVNLAALLG